MKGSRHSWGNRQGFEPVIISGIHLRGLGCDGRRCETVENLVEFSEILGGLVDHGHMGKAIKNLMEFFERVRTVGSSIGARLQRTGGIVPHLRTTEPMITRNQRRVSRTETVITDTRDRKSVVYQ